MSKKGSWLIIQDEDSGDLLMAKRAPHINSPNMWNFFGGNIDEGEKPKEACLREVFEEAGLRLTKKDIVKLRSFEKEDRQIHVFHLYVDKSLTIKMNDEHTKTKWFPIKKLPKKVNDPTRLIYKHVIDADYL